LTKVIPIAHELLYIANENGYHSLMTDDAAFPSDVDRSPDGEAAPPRRLRSDELFAGTREIVIEHHGRLYRLRITRNGKLILTA
jgi:hemin uptake protein HemP